MHPMYNRPVFVPNGEDRRATAVLLVGTAEEEGIDPRSILSKPSGFYITEELADAIGDDLDRSAPEAEVQEEEDVPPYSEWEYKDLKSEVATRNLDTKDQKSDTLVAALIADDEAQAE